MLNEEFRQKLVDNGFDESIVFDAPYFDNSIIGANDEGRLVYLYDKMVEEFMEDNDCPYDEAADFISYNTVRTLPYIHGCKPIIACYRMDEDVDDYLVDITDYSDEPEPIVFEKFNF